MATQWTMPQAMQALGEPSTAPGALAEIAQQLPSLRAQVSAHPQCYPELAQWIAQQPPVVAPPVVAPPVTAPAVVAPPVVAPNVVAPGTALAVPAAATAATLAAPAAATAATAGGAKVGLIVAGVTATALVAAGIGGVVVYNKVLGGDGGALDSASALPASTAVVVEMSVEPSTQQKLQLVQLLPRLDGVRDYLEKQDVGDGWGFSKDDSSLETDLRYYLWESFLESSDLDTRLDYDKDIASWMGGRIAMAVVDQEDVAAPVIIAIESKDDAKGVDVMEDFLDDLADAGMGGEDFSVEARHGYVLVYPDDLDLDDAYADGTLDKDPGYQATVPRLGERGLVSMWVGGRNMAALGSTLYGYDDFGYDFYGDDYDPVSLMEDAAELIDPSDASAWVLRAVGDGLEVQSAQSSAFLRDFSTAGEAVTQLGALPDTTAGAFAISGMGQLAELSLTEAGVATLVATSAAPELAFLGDSLDDVMDAVKDAQDEAEDQLGFTIAESQQVFDKGVVVAADEDLGCDWDDYECTDLRVGARMYGPDLDFLEDSLDDWVDDAELDDVIEFERGDSGAFVVVTTDGYMDDLTANASTPLSSLPEFGAALPQSRGAISAFFVRTDGVLSLLKDMDISPDKDVRNAIRDIAALGSSTHYEGNGVFTSRIRLVLE